MNGSSVWSFGVGWVGVNLLGGALREAHRAQQTSQRVIGDETRCGGHNSKEKNQTNKKSQLSIELNTPIPRISRIFQHLLIHNHFITHSLCFAPFISCEVVTCDNRKESSVVNGVFIAGNTSKEEG
jgi:hypothetical protein